MDGIAAKKTKVQTQNCPDHGTHLPEMIYSSKADTKGGNEDYIAADGSFKQFY